MRIIHAVPFLALAVAFSAGSYAPVSAQQQSVPRPPQFPGRDTGPQQPSTGTGGIAGTVSTTNGHPLRRASVRITSTTTPMSRNATTDDKGNFEIKDLPAGEFTLRANKGGYLESIYGQRNPGSGRPGTPISLKDGQHVEKLAIPVAKGGVITGTIVDDIGEPAFGVPVRAVRTVMQNGEKKQVSAGAATTDDRGVYRISTLPPGDYMIMATPRNDSGNDLASLQDKMNAESAIVGGIMRAASFSTGAPSAEEDLSSGYAPVFYPGTTMAASSINVALGAAEEKTGIDVPLQLVALGTITGTVVGDPRAVRATQIQLNDANTGLPGLTARTTNPDQNGKFTFKGLPPGTYNLLAKSGGSTTIMTSDGGGQTMMFMTREVKGTPGPGAGGGGDPAPAPPMWAKSDASVDGRTKTDVTLVLQGGMTITGHIGFDGTGELPTDFSQMRILLGSGVANGLITSSSSATVEADGKFKITDVMPGKYRVTATPPRNWRVRSAELAGTDTLDTMLDVKPSEDLNGLTITYTNRSTELGGVIQDSNGQPVTDYTIVLFAADQRFWIPQSRRILSARPSTDGHYTFRDLPEGDYRLVALDDVDPGQWFDPNFLRQILPSAMTVSIHAGDKKTQDLRVGK